MINPNSFFLTNGSLILAKNINNEAIFGEGNAPSWVDVKRAETTSDSLYKIFTTRNTFLATSNAKVAGTGQKFFSNNGVVNVENLEVGDVLSNYYPIKQINGLIRKDQPDSLHALLSYVCGFQSAMLRKTIKKQYIEIFTKNRHGVSEMSGLNKIFSLFTHFHFLNLENDKLHDSVFGDIDIVSINDPRFKDLNLTQMMVLWHRVFSIYKRTNKSNLFKLFLNLSKIRHGISTYSISNDDLRKTCCEDAQIPFLPSFCLNLNTNLLFFTIGFLTAWLWEVKIKLGGMATAVDSSDNFFDEKKFLKNDEIKIEILFHDPVLLLIARVLTLYGMDVRFASSDSTGKQHLCFRLRNIQNLLTNNFVIDKNLDKWSPILKIQKISDSKLIKIDAETDDLRWKPSIDFTLMRFH